MSSAVWIVGNATFTIVASRMTMNCAMQTSTSTSQRLGSGLTDCDLSASGRRNPDATDRSDADDGGSERCRGDEADARIDVPHRGVLLCVRGRDHGYLRVVVAQSPQRLELDRGREPDPAVRRDGRGVVGEREGRAE